MSAATDDIFSDTILNRIHALYLHCRLHHYYPNVIEVDSYYSTALFSNEPVLVTKVRWHLHEGRVVKRIYWVELLDELPPYAVSETPTPFLPSLVPLPPSSPTPSLLPVPISPPPAPSPPSPATSSRSSDTVVPARAVSIGNITEEDEHEWNLTHVPEEEEELEAHELELLYPYSTVDPDTLYESPPGTPLDRLDSANVSHSPESVLSPRPSLPYSPLSFGLARSPVLSDSDSVSTPTPVPTPEPEVVLSPAVMAAHDDIAAQLQFLRVQTEALNAMLGAQNLPNRVHLWDQTTVPPPPVHNPPPVPPPAPPAAPVIVEQKSKANVPDAYTGDRDKAKPFIRQLWLYFEARGPEFPSVRRKVVFALSYMRGGTAGPWADNLIDKIHEDDDMDRGFRFR